MEAKVPWTMEHIEDEVDIGVGTIKHYLYTQIYDSSGACIANVIGPEVARFIVDKINESIMPDAGGKDGKE